ncbi:hypothetical protein GCM10022244_59890 [Streptomyces gulbargensis]|uniref:Uncharacterized protein n=1 Tax=Streptomyces gulbargensis TaxID=364901 RepID=A0ABP7NEA5_9ACTN
MNRGFPFLLYARSRGLPGAVAALAGTAAVTAWAAWWLVSRPGFDHAARLPVVVLGPLLAAAAVGTSLHTPSDVLDRTAVRPWWRRRLLHVLVGAALAGALLAVAVPGHTERFGAPAAVRNALGLAGAAAGSTVLVGARLSWLPPTCYVGAVYLAAPDRPGGAAAWWAWVMQPGPEAAAWAVAGTAFVLGTALCAWRGPRPTGG